MNTTIQTYYNFTISENEISFDPYWYSKSNSIINSILGILVLAIGILLLEFTNSTIGLYTAFVIIFLLISNSLYLFLIRNKTTIKFDKKIDSFYKITPIAKKKICNLSSILAISSKSKSNSFYYQLTIKNGKSNRYLRFTSVIKSGHGNNPEIRFLQMEIIPQLELFLNTNKNKDQLYGFEDASI
ncbi:hypothetical protein [Flavobacterium sp. DG2-3]|uniref:hypothetical protein n=1 Tax=Flavobacterium sp. DG2-3 TaxID=3068317 RepID=UPI00273FA125|nr:hypothetical protein [Flavobacterium sp. DG2-3]MDP5200899.1 hypothetical protein [Flavobacterium sp. DG2-3]